MYIISLQLFAWFDEMDSEMLTDQDGVYKYVISTSNLVSIHVYYCYIV